MSINYSGELPTTANWIRQFVHTHPDYKQDSIVGEKIVYDLITKIKAISEGKLHVMIFEENDTLKSFNKNNVCSYIFKIITL